MSYSGKKVEQSIAQDQGISTDQFETYSKHRELAVVIQKRLLLPQFLVLADTFAEKMTNTGVARQHKSTNLHPASAINNHVIHKCIEQPAYKFLKP